MYTLSDDSIPMPSNERVDVPMRPSDAHSSSDYQESSLNEDTSPDGKGANEMESRFSLIVQPIKWLTSIGFVQGGIVR